MLLGFNKKGLEIVAGFSVVGSKMVLYVFRTVSRESRTSSTSSMQNPEPYTTPKARSPNSPASLKKTKSSQTISNAKAETL